MMYTMPKNFLSICVNFALATQQPPFFAKFIDVRWILLYNLYNKEMKV